MTKEAPIVVVGIVTCGRPEELGTCLATLRQQHGQDGIRFLVVDNDPQGAGKAPAEAARSEGLQLTYLTHTVPGIPSVRNFLVSATLEKWPQARWLAMIDDDAWAEDADWVSALLKAGDEAQADIVCGPQRYVALKDAPSWLPHASSLLDNAACPRGVADRGISTGNVLISTGLLRRLDGPWFDMAYTKSGGSDVAFFARARKAGARAYFEPSAVVNELCDGDRLTLKWWRRRMFRNGANEARVHWRWRSPACFVAQAAGDLAKRLGSVAWRLLFPSQPRRGVGAQLRLAWIVGYIAGAVGVTPKWYVQPKFPAESVQSERLR